MRKKTYFRTSWRLWERKKGLRKKNSSNIANNNYRTSVGLFSSSRSWAVVWIYMTIFCFAIFGNRQSKGTIQRRTMTSFRDLSNRMSFIWTIDICWDRTRRMVSKASLRHIFFVIERRSRKLNRISGIKVLREIVKRHIDFC